MSATAELACTYAALILHEEGIEITAEKINSLVSAANVGIEPIWSQLFAKAIKGVDLTSLVSNVGGSAPAAAAAPAAAPAASAAPAGGKAEEKKKEEKKEESDEDIGMSLFD